MPEPIDDPLQPLLGRWTHNPAPAPDFNQAVWSRIRAQNNTLGRILSFPLTFPLAACLALSFGALIGLGQRSQHDNNRMALAYAQSIDPLQHLAVSAHPHHHVP